MKRHPSRLVPPALVAVLVLAACGSDNGTADDGSVPSASSSSSDDGLLSPRPIELNGGGAAGNASGEAVPASDRAMSSDMIAPYRITNFVAGDALPALPTNDVGYVFQIGAAVTADQVQALAEALGVTGEAVRTDDDYSAWWTVGPNDGTAPSLTVYEDAQQSWNYSSAWADQAVSVGCGSSGSEGGVIAPEPDPAVDAPAPTLDPVEKPLAQPTDVAVPEMSCPTPEPPVGVLTASEAEARTRELMTATGLDPASYTFEPYADEWFASVSASEQLDGSFAGRQFGAGFGAEGALQYANGQLATPAKVGPYPLVDLATAIARLNDPSGLYGGYGGGGIAVDTVARGAATEPAIAPDIAEAPVSSTGEVPPGTGVAVTEVPEPETVTVTLVDVQADVWWAWDVDGSVWLLPAYRFIGDDGGWYTVPAVTDEYLIQVPAAEVTTDPGTVDPVPPTDAVDPAPGSGPDGTAFDSTQLDGSVGTTLAEFTAAAQALGATVRVVEIAGVSQAVTDDYGYSRVNVAVDGEGDEAIVTAIISVG